MYECGVYIERERGKERQGVIALSNNLCSLKPNTEKNPLLITVAVSCYIFPRNERRALIVASFFPRQGWLFMFFVYQVGGVSSDN